MPVTYDKIATTTLSSNQSSVTFSGISGTYTDLVLITNARSNRVGTQDTVVAYFNSDNSIANYSSTILTGNSTSASSSRVTGGTYLGLIGDCTASGSASSVFGMSITHFMNYANNTTNKSWISRTQADVLVEAYVGLWRSTATITSITIQTIVANQFVSGSTFTLYGILKA